MANPIGRPTLLNDEMTEKARTYMLYAFEDVGDIVPSSAGLACYLGVARSSLFLWGQKNEDFSNILEAIQAKQERLLLNGGLKGTYNSNITKLMLGKHGYHDTTESRVKLKREVGEMNDDELEAIIASEGSEGASESA